MQLSGISCPETSGSANTVCGDVGWAASATVLSPHSQAFLAHWKALRGDAPMPSAADIDPAGFVSLLPYMRYLSWSSPDAVRYRVWGTRLTEWMKADLTGRNVFELLPESEWEKEYERLRNLHRVPCGFVQQREVTDVSGMVHMFEFLTLPVGPGPDGADRMIGPGSICDTAGSGLVEFGTNPKTVIKTFSYIDLGFGIPEVASPERNGLVRST